MSDDRLASALIVSALCRAVQSAGGFATIIKRGDATSGGIMLECLDRGTRRLLFEKSTDFDGRATWRQVEGFAADANAAAEADAPTHPSPPDDRYRERMEKRLRSDPDLWLVELDIPQAERFAAEILSMS